MEEKVKKTKKPLLDDVHGLAFMERWPVAVRWISVLPVAIIIFIIVRILFIGTVLDFMTRSMPLIASYVGALAAFVVYFSVVDFSAAAAPAKRTVVALILAVCISGFLTYTALMFWNTLSFEPNQHTGIVLTLSTVCAVLGSFFGVKSTYAREKLKNQKLTSEE